MEEAWQSYFADHHSLQQALQPINETQAVGTVISQEIWPLLHWNLEINMGSSSPQHHCISSQRIPEYLCCAAKAEITTPVCLFGEVRTWHAPWCCFKDHGTDSYKQCDTSRPEKGDFFFFSSSGFEADAIFTSERLLVSLCEWRTRSSLPLHTTTKEKVCSPATPPAPHIKARFRSTQCSRLPHLWATFKAYQEDSSKNAVYFFDPDIRSGASGPTPPNFYLSSRISHTPLSHENAFPWAASPTFWHSCHLLCSRFPFKKSHWYSQISNLWFRWPFSPGVCSSQASLPQT